MNKMKLDLIDRESILKALSEFEALGRRNFLEKYGNSPAKNFFLRYKGNYYDSKAICGAAYGYLDPENGPLSPAEFSGGENTVKKVLNNLGFAVSKAPPTTESELLESLRTIRSYRSGEETAPHKYLLFLLICKTAIIGSESSTPLVLIYKKLSEVLETIIGSTPNGAIDPLWRLQFDGLWEITDHGEHLTDTYGGNDPPASHLLLQESTRGDLPQEIFEVISTNPAFLNEVFETTTDFIDPEALPYVQDWFYEGLEEYLNRPLDVVNAHSWNDKTGVRTWDGHPRGWLIRGGANGEDEVNSLNTGIASVGWGEDLPAPPNPVTETWLRETIEEAYPTQRPATRANFLGQLWPFMSLISEGDLIVMPLKSSPGKVAIGKCTRPFFVDEDEPTLKRKFRIGVDWLKDDYETAALGNRIKNYVSQPRTIGWLDDDTVSRLQAVLDTGSPRLYWWVNQGTSWEAEHKHHCICAPQEAKNGTKFRHHLDVGRAQKGDLVLHYADSNIWAVSEVLKNGDGSIRPYELGADRWQEEVFLARCWYDPLHASIPFENLGIEKGEKGPFTKSGGVKQGYLWPLESRFISQLKKAHEASLRGTPLNPGLAWVLQVNPENDNSGLAAILLEEDEDGLKHSSFSIPIELKTHYRKISAGDRALFWLAGENAGIYATGWIDSDPYQEGQQWKVNAHISRNICKEPFTKTDLLANPVLKNIGPIKFPPASSYEMSSDEWSEFTQRLIDRYLTNESNASAKKELPVKEKLQELAKRLYLEPSGCLNEIVSLLEDRPQTIFYGPPGTGKTFVAMELAKWIAGDTGKVQIVQFHPSYAYEDFVEGWRPTEDGSFKLKNGPLKRMAEQAIEEPEHTFVLVIDEINRANLSKVLGELFFLMEYRDHQVTLQYSEEAFHLPTNLKIIGTMNTADRSIALVDAALRRRFHFHPFFPDAPPIKGMLHRWLKANNPQLIGVAAMVDRANELLDDRNLAIGPSHFMKKGLAEETIQRIWRRTVLPYVEDQFFDDHTKTIQFQYESLSLANPPKIDATQESKDNDSTTT
jgi:MoxR-like ATPase